MVKIFGHRGFSAAYPENTMLAFEQALDAGCDGVEFDVQLTRDNVPVIIHDETLLRTAGDPAAVRDLHFTELARRDVSGRFLGQCPAQRVPALSEYFDLVEKTDFITNIELKTAIVEYDGIEKLVTSMVRDRKLAGRVILSSFNHYTLLRCKALAPEIPCGILYECRIAEPQDYARRLGMEYLHPCELFVTDAELAKYVRAGVPVSPWTVDDPERMRYFLSRDGVYALMTNRPDVALRVRGEM